MKHLYKPSKLRAPIEKALSKAEVKLQEDKVIWESYCKDVQEKDKELIAAFEQYEEDLECYKRKLQEYSLAGEVKSVSYEEPKWWHKLLGLNGNAIKEYWPYIEMPERPSPPLIEKPHIKVDDRYGSWMNGDQVKVIINLKPESVRESESCYRLTEVPLVVRYNYEEQPPAPSAETKALQELLNRLDYGQDYIQLSEKEFKLIEEELL